MCCFYYGWMSQRLTKNGKHFVLNKYALFGETQLASKVIGRETEKWDETEGKEGEKSERKKHSWNMRGEQKKKGGIYIYRFAVCIFML